MNRFVELGSIADFINGIAFKPSDWSDNGARIVRIQNLTDASKPYNRTTRIVDDRFRVKRGELLVSWSATLGVFEWPGPDDALVNQHIFRVEPDSQKVETRYLRHLLEDSLSKMRRHLHGATMQHINRNEFLRTQVYLPPLGKQRRIAEVLDKADALRAKRRDALAQLDTLTQSIFLEMFGDPVANSMDWPLATLAEVTTKITDGTHKTPTYVKSGIPFLSAKDLKDGRIEWHQSRFISPDEHQELSRRCNPALGDLLLAKSGSLGAVALVDRNEEFSLFESVCLMKHRRDVIDGRFLAAALRVPSLLSKLLRSNKGVAVKHLHLVDVRDLVLPLPPLELQLKFGKRLAAIEKLRAWHVQSRTYLDALFASLQHRAFRGEL